jgi:hypothetical protein
MMTKNEIEKTTKKAITAVADRLPELGPENITRAKENLSWANWFWTAKIGYIHHDERRGVTWQVVDKGKVRCIRVWDNHYCYGSLAIQAESMRLVNLVVEIDPYAVVVPLNSHSSRDTSEDPTEREVA